MLHEMNQMFIKWSRLRTWQSLRPATARCRWFESQNASWSTSNAAKHRERTRTAWPAPEARVGGDLDERNAEAEGGGDEGAAEDEEEAEEDANWSPSIMTTRSPSAGENMTRKHAS